MGKSDVSNEELLELLKAQASNSAITKDKKVTFDLNTILMAGGMIGTIVFLYSVILGQVENNTRIAEENQRTIEIIESQIDSIPDDVMGEFTSQVLLMQSSFEQVQKSIDRLTEVFREQDSKISELNSNFKLLEKDVEDMKGE